MENSRLYVFLVFVFFCFALTSVRKQESNVTSYISNRHQLKHLIKHCFLGQMRARRWEIRR